MNILTKTDLLKYAQNHSSLSFSLDRFEANLAVCENKLTEEIVNISKFLLPEEAKNGDILILKNNELFVDVEKTKSQQEEIKNLVEQLFKRKK